MSRRMSLIVAGIVVFAAVPEAFAQTNCRCVCRTDHFGNRLCHWVCQQPVYRPPPVQRYYAPPPQPQFQPVPYQPPAETTWTPVARSHVYHRAPLQFQLRLPEVQLTPEAITALIAALAIAAVLAIAMLIQHLLGLATMRRAMADTQRSTQAATALKSKLDAAAAEAESFIAQERDSAYRAGREW